MADQDIIRVIRQHLEGYVLSGESEPFFRKVYQGDPLSLAPVNRLVCFWNVGIGDPPEGRMTLGNWMRAHRLRVKCFWQPTPLESARNDQELEIFTVSHAVPGLFYGDTTLDGNASASLPEEILIESEQWPIGSDSPIYRTVTFDLVVTVLEGEAIAR